ncbi:site-specific integrase [Mucilaginibacter panaciglaebae]|uniref:Site-specific integrase n=1 Tax=Mucilaginibacter panaciglaebae TaxID=502331 RepID=A0ABP7WN37_9SPHI
MVTLKTTLDTRRKKSNGNYPVIFRITDFKKTYTMTSGIDVPEHLWDNTNREVLKAHPNAQSINTTLSKKYYQIQRAILVQQDNESFSFEDLKLILAGKPKVNAQALFKPFAEKLIAEMIEVKRTGNAIVYRTAVNRLLNYYGDNKLKLVDINYNLLDGFSRSLVKQGIKQNSISNYFRSIRAIYNKAIKAKLVERSAYPFRDISIKTEKTAKRAITRVNIRQFEQLKLTTNTPEWHARNYFILSFYLIGISFTDLAYLKPGNIIKGRLEYKRRKTHKLYSIKVFPQAEQILKLYANQSKVFLLPVLPDYIEEDTLESKKLIFQWIKTTNKYLNRLAENLSITEPVTTYVGRHTFATTAKRMGYSNELIAEALGHEYGNRITNIYLDAFDKEVVDKMHEAVINSSCHENNDAMSKSTDRLPA